MAQTTIEAEVIQEKALAIRDPQQSPALFGTTEPIQIVTKATEVANSLKMVIKQQGLISNIQGKEYPRCEAWTLLGTMLGVFPVCVWTKQLEGGWEARVEARTRDGSILGAAEAQCLKTERNWSNRDDFALRSMAQTRATAKALRMPLGFVMTLAGFEATPSEEMEAIAAPSKPVAPKFKLQDKSDAPKPKSAPNPIVAPKQAIPGATPEQKAKMIAVIEAEGPDAVQKALGYFIEVGALLPVGEGLSELPLHWVPATQGQFRELAMLIAKLNDTGKAEKPAWVYSDRHIATADVPIGNPAAAFNAEELIAKLNDTGKAEKPAWVYSDRHIATAAEEQKVSPFADAPASYTGPSKEQNESVSFAKTPIKQPELPVTEASMEPWYKAIVPIPHKGQKRADYIKSPDTIGSLFDARHDDEDSRRRLFGFVSHFEPKPWTGQDGKSRPPSKSDIDFRNALDEFADWYEENHSSEEFD